MRSPLVLLLLPFAVFANGCDYVTARHPFGEKIDAAEYKSLEGDWIDERGQVMCEVHVTRDGQLAIGQLHWDAETQEFSAANWYAIVTRNGDLEFIHVVGAPHERYFFARIDRKPDSMRIYAPVVSVFETAVFDNKLKGSLTLDKDITRVHVMVEPVDMLSFIKKTGPEKCFADVPIRILTRIPPK